jgi:hypothetical protein
VAAQRAMLCVSPIKYFLYSIAETHTLLSCKLSGVRETVADAAAATSATSYLTSDWVLLSAENLSSI